MPEPDELGPSSGEHKAPTSSAAPPRCPSATSTNDPEKILAERAAELTK
ncbi:hypothetical protein [Polyangium spumosum]|uniref:Uncharacterized protein n=1 Tax=Polyangium spumosum TaxID=889282 RepID=A0A6N7PIM1_9BACT|nr:hypothetical protein [Polyangium spumosum]MRG91667.1 hypothetical protein [Polyangium spumosum]